jgi:hypothetical protein
MCGSGGYLQFSGNITRASVVRPMAMSSTGAAGAQLRAASETNNVMDYRIVRS